MAEPFLVSVIIPVYNAEKYVEEAVASALQFACVQEVVLVDDAGPDNSLEVCKAIAAKEPRVKLFRHPGGVNRGAGASRNLGMEQATSPWIAFLDADDYYLPNRFDAERQVLREHPDAEGVYGALAPRFDSPEAAARYERFFSTKLTTVRERVAPEKLLERFISTKGGFGHFHLDTLTFRRSVLGRMHEWMRSDLPLHQDWDFMIRLMWHARLYPGNIEEPVAIRRMHDDNRVTTANRTGPLQVTMYRGLWEWSKAEGLPGSLVYEFHRRYRHYSVVNTPTKLGALAMVVRFPGLFMRPEFRSALKLRLLRRDR